MNTMESAQRCESFSKKIFLHFIEYEYNKFG